MTAPQCFTERGANGQLYLWEYANYSLILLGIYGSPLMAKAALAIARMGTHPAQITGVREELITSNSTKPKHGPLAGLV